MKNPDLNKEIKELESEIFRLDESDVNKKTLKDLLDRIKKIREKLS